MPALFMTVSPACGMSWSYPEPCRPGNGAPTSEVSDWQNLTLAVCAAQDLNLVLSKDLIDLFGGAREAPAGATAATASLLLRDRATSLTTLKNGTSCLSTRARARIDTQGSPEYSLSLQRWLRLRRVLECAWSFSDIDLSTHRSLKGQF